MPIKDVRPFKANSDNVAIFNAVRRQSSNEFQSRIPAATKANMQKTAAEMIDYEPTRNEFIAQFINRIGLTIARNKMWTNPLAVFKIGMMQYGDTIEEYMTGLTEAYTYDPDRESLEQTIWGQEPNEVQVNYHKINRQNYYKLSVSEVMLRRAFDNPTGLAQLITQLMAVPTKSDQYDEFLVMSNLFSEYVRQSGGGYTVQVNDLASPTSTAVDAKGMIRAIRQLTTDLTFISRDYNVAGMPSHADPEDLIFITTSKAQAAVDVEALAAAFNLDKLSMASRTIVLPEKYVNIPGFQGMLTTKDFFVVADTLITTRSIENPVDLVQNFFFHHHQIVSFSRFVPAVIFWTGPGTEIEIESTPVTDVAPLVITDRNGTVVTDVTRGEMYNIFGTAVTLPTGGYNDAVRLTLTGSESPLTFITQTGMLHVSPTEESDALTVTAIATDDNTKTETLVIDVIGDILQLWPQPEVIEDVTP